MKFCSSGVTHTALETGMYTLALSKHPIQKYPQNTEKDIFIHSTPCCNKQHLPHAGPTLGAGEEAGKGREGAGWDWHSLLHSPVWSHPRQSRAALTLPFPKRAELGTSKTQGESSGYLFLLVTHLWCVNSKSIWQHFERQLNDSRDGNPWVSFVLRKAQRCCCLELLSHVLQLVHQ